VEGRKNGLREYVDQLQSQGRYVFTRDEGLAALGCTRSAFMFAVNRLTAAGRIVSPRRGFHVIVPVEYRSAGGPPADWYIDALMAFHGQPYCVGLLSAAALHGASHQQPQELQVVTSAPLRPVTAGRVRIRFFQKASIEQVPTEKRKTYTGYMSISTPEATALDLVRYPHACGGLGNVATVLGELAEKMAPEPLAAAVQGAESAHVQRLGHLLELVGREALAVPLAAWVAKHGAKTYRLRPDLPATGAELSRRWRLVINETVEVDL
jgi:predicted transcriptional regulator of viral defense system